MTEFAADRRPIVVGVDGSEVSRTALRWAVEEAARRGAPVHAITAWRLDPGPLIGAVPLELGSVWNPEAWNPEAWNPEAAHQEQERLLADLVGEVPAGVEVRRFVASGDPRRVLVDASENAALLVVGSHGAGRLAGVLMGSVSSYCVRHSACPIVVIRDRHTDVDVPERTASATPLVPAPITPGPLL
jgi:nucleotide-binding universal stress UspA family protein